MLAWAGMLRACTIVLLTAAVACDGGGDSAPADSKPPAPAPVVSDAGVPPADAAAAAATVPPAAGDFHLDDPDIDYRRSPQRRGRTAVAEVPHIHMILRSSPAGAVASVDGTVIGRTPAYWEGEANGQPREVTFVLPGHAMARYRFIPVTSGTIHGKLDKLRVELPDAGPPPGPGEIPIPGYPDDL